jgi:hypothetical protein
VKQCQQVLEWQEEARAEAIIETRRWSVLRALQLRFCPEVPADLAEAINKLTDPDELWRWFEASQTADSLASFRAGVESLTPAPDVEPDHIRQGP